MFEVKTSKSIDRNKIVFSDNGFYDFVGRSNVNNGVQGKIDKLDFAPNPSKTFSLVQVGESVCLYRDREWYSSQNIFVLFPHYKELVIPYNFISSVVNKALQIYKSAYVYPTLEDVKNIKIQVPIKNSKIDYQFMEAYIAELEAYHVAELEAYLLATGLKDYKLTDEEERAIKEYGKWTFKQFSFSNIFNKIQQGRRLKKDDQLPGDIPFVMAGVTNTGVVGYISNPVAKFPKNSITVDIFGNCFYRNYNFGAGDDTGVYWRDDIEYSREEMLFFTTSMEKFLNGKFSYGKKLRSSQSLDFKMYLPEANEKFDTNKMKLLISAIQKLVIKDVVLYSERKIETTKKVVEG